MPEAGIDTKLVQHEADRTARMIESAGRLQNQVMLEREFKHVDGNRDHWGANSANYKAYVEAVKERLNKDSEKGSWLPIVELMEAKRVADPDNPNIVTAKVAKSYEADNEVDGFLAKKLTNRDDFKKFVGSSSIGVNQIDARIQQKAEAQSVKDDAAERARDAEREAQARRQHNHDYAKVSLEPLAQGNYALFHKLCTRDGRDTGFFNKHTLDDQLKADANARRFGHGFLSEK